MSPVKEAPVHPIIVVPFESDTSPALLRRLAHLDVPERWRAVDRSAHAPHIVAVPGDDDDATDWTGAALVSARPGTAYLKIVDAVGDVRAAVAAVVAHARDQGLAQVKWEGWTASSEDAAAAGFTPMCPPLTPPDDATEPVAGDATGPAPGDTAGPATGYVRWLHDGVASEPPPNEPPYYGQTTHFTCGAVTALLAQAHAGTLPPEALDRRAELALWRDATNFLACEPVGLGVAVRRAWPSTSVTVHLDVDRPVLLDHLPDGEQEWRALLQRESRTQAAHLGVPVDARHLSLAAIRAALDRREHVLLLVSLAAMQGFDVPHWVLCHGVVPGAVVIEDPWASAAAGDTWVDAHLLPVADASLDGMATVSADRFRGAVRIGHAPEPAP
ncbi:peptidase C39 family protein [Streptomyces sp. BH106]|uniref:peptidase C39 family protein n=1 Tax=Streptomyces sp. BH106 TaxID=3410409 RepID=UPI003CE705B9